MKPCARTVAVLLALASSARAQSAMDCPDSVTPARMVDYELGRAHAEWLKNPQTQLPPICVYEAIARAPLAHSDSAVAGALDFSAEALKRSPGDALMLRARIVLLYRAQRYAEVAPAMDELFFTGGSARVSEQAHRVTVAAAMQLRDTAAIINRLANAAERYPRANLFAPEYEVWRQLGRLRALVDSVHRRMKQDPRVVGGYASLASIYGSLDRPDSAIAYTKLALNHGVSRPLVEPALGSLIGVRLRRAQILGSPAVWRATLPVARAADSALSTPSSKYLVAIALLEIVADEARLAQAINYSLGSGEPGGPGRIKLAPGQSPTLQVMTCERLVELDRMVQQARANLDAGGDKFAVQTIPAMRSGLAGMTATLAQLKPRCTG